jgi:hypothetical protein
MARQKYTKRNPSRKPSCKLLRKHPHAIVKRLVKIHRDLNTPLEELFQWLEVPLNYIEAAHYFEPVETLLLLSPQQMVDWLNLRTTLPQEQWYLPSRRDWLFNLRQR